MRRLIAVFALASSSLVALAVPVPVHAANIAPETDLIARKLTTQTTGPSGFQSPNDVIPWGLDRIDSRTGRDWVLIRLPTQQLEQALRHTSLIPE
jgi:hypothetical protein